MCKYKFKVLYSQSTAMTTDTCFEVNSTYIGSCPPPHHSCLHPPVPHNQPRQACLVSPVSYNQPRHGSFVSEYSFIENTNSKKLYDDTFSCNSMESQARCRKTAIVLIRHNHLVENLVKIKTCIYNKQLANFFS